MEKEILTVYISESGETKDVRTMNSVYLLSAYAKAIRGERPPYEKESEHTPRSKQNVEVCKNEILRRIALGEESKTA